MVDTASCLIAQSALFRHPLATRRISVAVAPARGLRIDNPSPTEWNYARGARLAVGFMKVKDLRSPYERFRVKRDAPGSDVLASFDTLEEAIRSVRHRRQDWRYVIFDGQKIVWPESRTKIE